MFSRYKIDAYRKYYTYWPDAIYATKNVWWGEKGYHEWSNRINGQKVDDARWSKKKEKKNIY